MSESLKVQPHHLERDAYLYIRQSSMRQVVENIESTKRQYALRARATALGWPEDRIVVIDSDQGESGASAAWREGFRRLVTDVGLGRAGIVMGLEVSRLARNNADWHRLLEICALANTLILDEDGIYDPTHFNDRLLLGLKGTMSEAELHVLKARLRGGILNKVRRGEYRCVLPTGLVYDEAGDVVLDPDSQVRETIAYFFETFSRVGSAHQTIKVFRSEGLQFPSRIRRHGDSTVVFRPLTASTAIRTLHNPRYAGAYAYGRRSYPRTPDGKKAPASELSATGSPASRTPIPATSRGTATRRTSGSSKPMIDASRWPGSPHPVRARLCSKVERSVGAVAGISA
jgi:DNA invertase Pin-like site-specific DNA recombinase